jgi:hypothetical protein
MIAVFTSFSCRVEALALRDAASGRRAAKSRHFVGGKVAGERFAQLVNALLCLA